MVALTAAPAVVIIVLVVVVAGVVVRVVVRVVIGRVVIGRVVIVGRVVIDGGVVIDNANLKAMGQGAVISEGKVSSAPVTGSTAHAMSNASPPPLPSLIPTVKGSSGTV